jgi:hypothetical protein
MHKERVHFNRRRFLKKAAQAGALLAMPYVVPGTALGKSGAVAPSEQLAEGTTWAASCTSRTCNSLPSAT